jgi:uncharacterized membrane protein
MTDNTENLKNPYHILACISLIALIILLVLWEMVLAPLRPDGSWMVLKVIPLLFPLRGVLTHKNYTMQWSSMMILLYFMEGVVRASSDISTLSRALAGLEILFSVGFFLGSLLYLRPYKKVAKELKKKTASESTQ